MIRGLGLRDRGSNPRGPITFKMAVKKKKIGAAGRFGAGYGKVKNKLIAVEAIQRTKQDCPFCKGRAKRQARSIWLCSKCGKKFAGGTFHLKD
jgi:large subunit ribosomal protein L37Ae